MSSFSFRLNGTKDREGTLRRVPERRLRPPSGRGDGLGESVADFRGAQTEGIENGGKCATF